MNTVKEYKKSYPPIYHKIVKLEELLFGKIPAIQKDYGVIKRQVLMDVHYLRSSVYLMMQDPKNFNNHGLMADSYLESVKVNCRILSGLSCLSRQFQTEIIELLADISKQLYGWINSKKQE